LRLDEERSHITIRGCLHDCFYLLFAYTAAASPTARKTTKASTS